jgi:hypothetical protein
MAQYLKEKGSLSIRRVVKTPKRWDRIQAIASQFASSFRPRPTRARSPDFWISARLPTPGISRTFHSPW